MRRAILCLTLLAQPLAAQTPMGAEAFQSYTEGRTLTFSADGMPYGVEEYGPDRSVRWSFLDGQCREGRWYPEDGRICFVYEDMGGGPRCWTFWREGGGLRARFAGDPAGAILYETDASEEPLECLGPEVGV